MIERERKREDKKEGQLEELPKKLAKSSDTNGEVHAVYCQGIITGRHGERRGSEAGDGGR